MHPLTQKKIVVQNDEGYLISDGDENIVYFPLKSMLLKVSSKAVLALLEASNTPLLSKLTQQIAAELVNVDEHEFVDVPVVDKNSVETNALGIALTTSCNLACSYCHADSCKEVTSAEDEIINSAISMNINNCNKNKGDFYLIFIGSGEPTVNWEGLKRTLSKARYLCDRDGIRLHTIMSTNGYYGDRKRKYICDNFSRVSLSLDGPEEVHDENRLTHEGKGSFSKVFSTGKYFFRKKLPFGVRATVSQYGVGRMLSTYEFFQEHFPGVTVAFEPLIPMGRGVSHPESIPKERDFVQGYCSILDKYGKDYIANSGVSFKKMRKKFCGPVGIPHFNVEIDGLVHGCSRVGSSEKFIYGRYNKESKTFDIDFDTRNRMSEIDVNSFSECNDCFARYHCAGDCHDFRELNYSRCKSNRAIMWRYLCNEIHQGE